MRHQSHIKPSDPRLLTELDVDPTAFHCCGQEWLVFLRCEHCGHIWVDCFECSTWFVDLTDLDRFESSVVPDPACPACHRPFADRAYLRHECVDRYLATAEQVRAAGFERFLAQHLRATFQK